MKNITVKITDVAYFRARVWAAERNTSVSAVVAWFLSNLPTHKGAARQFSPNASSSIVPARSIESDPPTP